MRDAEGVSVHPVVKKIPRQFLTLQNILKLRTNHNFLSLIANGDSPQNYSSLRVSRAAVGNALEETRREENAYAFPAQCRLPLKLPTFRVTIALQLLQIVMVTKQLLRLYSFQSVFFSPFHYSVTDVKIHRKSAILGGGTFSSEGNVSAKVFIFR